MQLRDWVMLSVAPLWPMVFRCSPVCLCGQSLGSNSSLPPSQSLLGMGSLNTSSPAPRSFLSLSLTCKEGSCPLSPLDSLQVKDPWLLPLLQPGDQLRLEDQESCCGDGREGDCVSMAEGTAQGPAPLVSRSK